jgi:hypothetical protein
MYQFENYPPQRTRERRVNTECNTVFNAGCANAAYFAAVW